MANQPRLPKFKTSQSNDFVHFGFCVRFNVQQIKSFAPVPWVAGVGFYFDLVSHTSVYLLATKLPTFLTSNSLV